MHQLCKNLQALCIVNSVCVSVVKDNCQGRKQPIILKENKPLPNHHRIRKAPCTQKKEKTNNNHFTLLQPDDDQSDLVPADDDYSDLDDNYLYLDDSHSDSYDNHSDLDDSHSDLQRLNHNLIKIKNASVYLDASSIDVIPANLND